MAAGNQLTRDDEPDAPRNCPLEGHDHVARGDYQSAQRQETNQGHRSSIIISKSKNAIGARALYSPPSPPVSSTPGRSFGHGGNSPSSTPRASTGAFRRGGQFSTRANSGHASNTKGPLRRKTCTQKTTMTPVVATIRLRRSSPRSRGPPSQSESDVWDKALICRRPGESNSSI